MGLTKTAKSSCFVSQQRRFNLRLLDMQSSGQESLWSSVVSLLWFTCQASGTDFSKNKPFWNVEPEMRQLLVWTYPLISIKHTTRWVEWCIFCMARVVREDHVLSKFSCVLRSICFYFLADHTAHTNLLHRMEANRYSKFHAQNCPRTPFYLSCFQTIAFWR